MVTRQPADAGDLMRRFTRQPAGAGDLMRRFGAAVAAHPDRTAVTASDGTMTFAQLDARVDSVARLLRSRGATRGALVGVCLPRCTDLLVTFLAAWRAGAAYLPLDPAYPPERLRWMVADAGARVVVTVRSDDSPPGTGWPDGCRVAALDRLDTVRDAGCTRRRVRCGACPRPEARCAGCPLAAAGRPERRAEHHAEHHAEHNAGRSPESGSAADPAYVIYTSGSTGRPKGVLVSRGNVARFVRSLEVAGLYSDGPRVVAWNASASFDASVQQWVRVCRGDTVVLIPEELRTEPRQLADFLQRHGVTDIDATPSHWGVLHDELVAARRDAGPLRLLLGGEAVPERLWAALVEARESGTLEPANVYGPTECTVDATATWIEGASPHIGGALPGVRAYVLDGRLRPAGAGVPGDLYLAGTGVAHGYVDRPGLTAERFVADPFGPPGDRMYRTGDRARRRRGGALEYLGRSDRQLKINGQRIEPGEIETVLAGHPGVGSAVALVRPGPGTGPRLVAYYTAAAGAVPPSGEALREHAAASLPPAMVPSAYVALEAIPRTVSGKTDHAALPDPPPGDTAAGEEEPTLDTDLERLVADTWADVLGTGTVGADADFFALGGHSLQALRLGTRLKDRLGVAVPTRAVYRHPRLREYASEVQSLLDAGAREPERGPAARPVPATAASA